MIVLDTNVLSTLMRAEPDASVVRWLDAQPAVLTSLARGNKLRKSK
jgi:predicted nucleic acid-binding protein